MYYAYDNKEVPIKGHDGGGTFLMAPSHTLDAREPSWSTSFSANNLNYTRPIVSRFHGFDQLCEMQAIDSVVVVAVLSFRTHWNG